MDAFTPTTLVFLTVCILVVAVLYSSVGHGGASGYIAVLALFSVPPLLLKPTALILNILVSLIAAFLFARAGHFSWRLFWPFAITSIPCSFIGGSIDMPSHLYKPLLGSILLYSALHLYVRARHLPINRPTSQPPILLALVCGCVMGILSGLTGVGGGIFFSPLLLMSGWGTTREVSGVAALVILVNSAAGLAGHTLNFQMLPSFIPFIALAAIIGGSMGAVAGSRRLPTPAIIKALSVVLIIAGTKLLFT